MNVVPAAMAALVLVAGCSGPDRTGAIRGGGDPALTASTTDRAEGAPSGSGAAGSSGEDTKTSTTSSGASEGEIGVGPAPSDDGPPAPTNIRLDRECVARGSLTEQQGFVADVAPGKIVIYSTAYSDQSNELTNPEYTSGFGSVTAGPDGRARAMWTVPEVAPQGTATVYVAGNTPVSPDRLEFEVVERAEECP